MYWVNLFLVASWFIMKHKMGRGFNGDPIEFRIVLFLTLIMHWIALYQDYNRGQEVLLRSLRVIIAAISDAMRSRQLAITESNSLKAGQNIGG